MEKKLFLLDAFALIYRGYFALSRSPRITSSGIDTTAVFAFILAVDDIIRKESPSHLAVCFDPPGGHTFRHDMFADYKANREKQPEAISWAIPYIKRYLKAMNITVVELPEFEADDVIGTLSRQSAAAGFITYMVTPDKDYGQLVTDNVLQYRPRHMGSGFETLRPHDICTKFGIDNTRQVIDFLALQGDKVDNVPGCPGVGEKRAKELIAEFGSVEGIIANSSKIKGALRQKVEDNVPQIILSKDLVTIRTDVPVDLDLDTTVSRQPDVEALRALYEELEFKSFASKLPKPAAAPELPADGGSLFDFDCQPEPVAVPKAEYTVDASDLLVRALSAPIAAISFYAVGESAMSAQIQGAALALGTGDAAYIPLQRLGELAPVLGRDDLTLVSHDLKRDLLLMRRLGLDCRARLYDTSLAHYLLQPELRHSLADVAFEFLNGYRTLDYDNPRRSKEYRPIDPAATVNTVCEIADITLQVYPLLLDALQTKGVNPQLQELEQNLLPVLAEMEWTGVRIDPTILQDLSAQLQSRVDELEKECHKLAGKEFNVSSPMQVGQVLFVDMQIDPKVKPSKTGTYSTTEAILEKYQATVPIVGIILEIRKLKKLLSTYINALPAMINPADGHIHTTFNQTATATGRLSSLNPNLQNIPVRTDLGREIRRAFIPDPGCLLLAADYSQIELRLMADISGDSEMIADFAHGEDIHRATAAKIYHVPLEEVTDTQRRNAKTANFGIIYGISTFGLSERLGISRAEAKTLIDGYFNTYPGVKKYMADVVDRARAEGYVATVMGRRRQLPDINSRNGVLRGYAERNAINAPLQGSAADIIKEAMVRIAGRIRSLGLKSRLIIQVHDELVFNVHPDELAVLQQIVAGEMQGAYSGQVPLTVSIGVADNWLDAH